MRDDTASTRRGFIKGAAAATAVAAGVTGMISKAGARVPPLFNGITRAGQHPSGSPTNPPPPKYEARREAGLLIERDIAVRLRDGVRIYVDIYRPDGPPGEKDLPVIIGWGPYGKHTVGRTYSRESGVRPEWVSKYTGFEGVNPLYWVPRGYAIVNANPRGTWGSQGDATYWGHEEAADGHDLIEWAAAQAWCNGKVGLAGVSYLAIMQWLIAATRPPHLAAINPWEGLTDMYREFAFHGGIPETFFTPIWQKSVAYSMNQVEDTAGDDETASFVRRLLGHQGRRLCADRRAGIRGGELGGSRSPPARDIARFDRIARRTNGW